MIGIILYLIGNLFLILGVILSRSEEEQKRIMSIVCAIIGGCVVLEGLLLIGQILFFGE